MALTTTQIDVIFEEVLARHASAAEQATYAALSLTDSVADIDTLIEKLPEAANFVDPVIRLYQGAFNRVPDTAAPGSPSGFSFWVNGLRNGASLQSEAESFVSSAEFHAIYGSTTVTAALITAFYHNILGRDPAASEVAFWVAGGADAASILVGFTQSAEFIAKSQASVDAFKLALANGQHPSGPLPPPPPAFTLTSDHDIGGVNEGSAVTFTLQGPIADAGQLFSWNLSGIDPARVVGGQLAGSVTLDAQGLAHVVVNVIADNKTDGPTTMTLAFGSLTDSVAVNDTSLTPPPPMTQFFTATVGETLVGGAVNTVFQGTVDTVIAGNNTLSNVVDVAQGNPAFNNTEYVIIDNSTGTNITPSSTGVQDMKFTNLDASGKGGLTNVNAQFMHDVTTVESFGSSKGMNIFNLQNFISTIKIEQSDAPGGLNFNVKMIDSTPVGGTQTIDLINAGTAGGGTFLMDETTSGKDVVGEFDINSLGTNSLTIDGTSVATTVRVADSGTGADVTTLNSTDETEALTLIDTTGVAGAVTFNNGWEVDENNTLTINEGSGTNTFNLEAEQNSTLKVNGVSGTDTLNVQFTADGGSGGQTVNITEGDGNDTLNITNPSGGNFQSVTAVYGNGNDNLAVTSGNNANVSLMAGNGNDSVGVSVAELSTVKVALGNGANNVTVDDGEQSNVTVTGGNGGNNVTINTVDSDTLPSAGEIDGHQTYTVTLGTGANNLAITPGGSDPAINGDDAATGDFHVPNGEPDSVIASNQTITVKMGVGGTAAQNANIETGVNSQVGVTTGDGNSNITIVANNDLWTHDPVTDTVSFAGEGGSKVTVQTGNGNNTVNVNVDNTGFDITTGKWLDAGSNVQITTGTGNDNIIVTLGTAGQGNTANVLAGAGNDRVQFDVADINSGIVANGGLGTNTIALVSASAGAGPAALAGLSNFEILEVTNVLANNVNLDSYEPANTINHVVLDQGFDNGSRTISGAEQNFQLDLLAGSAGHTLNVLVDNAAINTNDAVGIKLDAGDAGVTVFGTVNVNPIGVNVVENVTIDSTSTNPMATENDLHLSDLGLQSLTIAHDAGGDVTLNLDGSTTNFIGSALTSVQAATFTGGIIWDDAGNGLGNDNNNITFNAPVSGNDSLRFGNGNDTVTLGNGNDTVSFGTGSNSYTAGNGNNNVTFNTSAGHSDTVNLGSGSDSVTFTGNGGAGSSITFAAHGANVDTVTFGNTGNSVFSTPDTITGFQAGTDILDFHNLVAPAGFTFTNVTSDAGVIASDINGGTKSEFIYNTSSGHLFVDLNHDGHLDMEVTLTGIPAIGAGNIHTV